MKTFRKIEFNSSKLNHEEMKNIIAGNYGGYVCNWDSYSSGSYSYSCSSAASSCITNDGAFGVCAIEITGSPWGKSCTCYADSTNQPQY